MEPDVSERAEDILVKTGMVLFTDTTGQEAWKSCRSQQTLLKTSQRTKVQNLPPQEMLF